MLPYKMILVLLWMVYPTLLEAKEVVYQKHTVVDFGDDTIEGDLSKPDAQYLESLKRLKHQRLIHIRENFRSEILQSVRGL